MIEETIARLEARVRAADSLPAAKRQELEELLAKLRNEIESLPEKPSSAQLAIEPDTVETEDVQSTLGRLEQSLAGFETTHPQVIGMVNRISTILANMGI